MPLYLRWSFHACYLLCAITSTSPLGCWASPSVDSDRQLWNTSEPLKGDESKSNHSSIRFDLSVINSTGHDTVERVAVFLHQQSTTAIGRRKQASSRPINKCPNGLEFLGSRCIRSQSPQAYSTLCSALQDIDGGRSIRWGSCAPNEICIDGRANINAEGHSYPTTTAWCVSQENFVRIAMTEDPSRTLPSTVQTTFNAIDAGKYSVEALLTSLDSRTAVEAQNLDIQAQTRDYLHDVQTWRTLNAGEMECGDCSSVGIMSLPARTQRIMTHVELKEDSGMALLYLASVPVIGG